ncbi:unnamed protein product [Lepidochelys olivacea]
MTAPHLRWGRVCLGLSQKGHLCFMVGGRRGRTSETAVKKVLSSQLCSSDSPSPTPTPRNVRSEGYKVYPDNGFLCLHRTPYGCRGLLIELLAEFGPKIESLIDKYCRNQRKLLVLRKQQNKHRKYKKKIKRFKHPLAAGGGAIDPV